MKIKIIEKILKLIQKGTFISTIFNRCPFRLITNRKVQDIVAINSVYTKQKKKYGYIQDDYIKKEDERGVPNIIWILWLQGIENAPYLVRKCIESVYSTMPQMIIRLIDEKSVEEYITIPYFILERHRKEEISHAHFSDYIRVALLSEYGGYWIDATCFITEDISHYFFNCDMTRLFVFKDRTYDFFGCGISNWFIAANSHSNIICYTRILLEKYWKENNKAEHYFIFHILFSIACELFPEEWAEVITFYNGAPHILSSEMNRTYEEERFKRIMQQSCIHKLSNKRQYNTNDITTIANRILGEEK